MAQDSGKEGSAPIRIKKYANRRLYNTDTSSYVTLDHLCRMVKEGQDFVVHDAKTGEDITRQVLTQIIFEEESKGQNLLPMPFLRQLIRFYGDSLEAVVPGYLEASMEFFSRNQDRMRRQLDEAFGGVFPFRRFDELSRENLAMFQNAMSMFAGVAAASADENQKDGRTAGGREAPGDEEIAELRAKLDEMERQLDKLAKKK